MGDSCNLLTLTPYRILPATNGGHLGIVSMHEYLGRICQDHLIGTLNNGDDSNYSFQLHKIYPAHPLRYLPLYHFQKISAIARRYDANAIFCDHPYLALTAIALSKKLRIPWFLRSHNIESERFRSLGKKWWRLLRAYEQYAMRQADGILFITPEDRAWAVKEFRLKSQKAHLIPYGTVIDKAPHGKEAAKSLIAPQFQLNPSKPWIYFLGAMDYRPNIEAVEHIVHEIAPVLQEFRKDDYQILIAGKGLPTQLQQIIANTNNVSYLGFLPEVDTFITACDVMINPMLSGGGIKTKAVEALGFNKTVVSTQYGAAGIIPEVCGTKLHIVADNDWKSFGQTLLRVIDAPEENIPDAFYQTYYWGNIAQNVVRIMREQLR